jgi:hypothetical protein
MYKVILGRVCELLLPWERVKYYIFVYVCACARLCKYVRACVFVNGRARGRMHVSARVYPFLSSLQHACAIFYCHLCSLWLHHNFGYYLIKRHDFQKKVLNIKYFGLLYKVFLKCLLL